MRHRDVSDPGLLPNPATVTDHGIRTGGRRLRSPGGAAVCLYEHGDRHYDPHARQTRVGRSLAPGCSVVALRAKTVRDLFAGGVRLPSSYDWAVFFTFVAAAVVFLAGLLFLGSGLLSVIRRRAIRRDDLIVGAALVLTAFGILVLFPYRGDALFSDVASSVSNAPG